mmetsp:Transcript_28137/g.73772  ORF Transcript_28137/g.73772 Transcript_28137/m.73772 type:complete len:207 (-) Transcript_28137:428-1048(-)
MYLALAREAESRAARCSALHRSAPAVLGKHLSPWHLDGLCAVGSWTPCQGGKRRHKLVAPCFKHPLGKFGNIGQAFFYSGKRQAPCAAVHRTIESASAPFRDIHLDVHRETIRTLSVAARGNGDATVFKAFHTNQTRVELAVLIVRMARAHNPPHFGLVIRVVHERASNLDVPFLGGKQTIRIHVGEFGDFSKRRHNLFAFLIELF